MRRLFVAFCLILGSSFWSQAGILETLGLKKTPVEQVAADALSQDDLIGGLKQALGEGVSHAIQQLGRDGGFLTNSNVRIPMPEKLHQAEKTLRLLKQDKVADDFIATMNHAAEQAVPEATDVFRDAIKGMSFSDAKTILKGTNTAATAYFRRTTETNLFQKFLPIVQQATGKTGATAAYKRMTDAVKPKGALGSLTGSFISTDSLDLDNYVTTKALDGLFTMVADQEKKIRENPAARTTELLQKVFSAVGKP
jgi:hypothetical protein